MEQSEIISGLKDLIKDAEKHPIVKNYKSLNKALAALIGTNELEVSHDEAKDGDNKRTVSEDGKSNKKLVAEIFQTVGRFLHITEVIEIAKDKGIEMSEKSIKQSVYNLKADGKLITYSINSSLQNTVWGAPRWMDENGNIRPEHMYSKNLFAKQNEEIDI